MAPGKGGKDELAGVWVAGVDGQAGALGDCVNDGKDVGKVELGPMSLRVQVHGERDEVDVSGAFAVAENGALDSVCSCQTAQLGSRDCAPAVVVGVERYDAFLALGYRVAKLLDLIGKDVRRIDFNCRRKVLSISNRYLNADVPRRMS